MPKRLRAVWLFIADAFDDLFLFPTSQDRKNTIIREAITASPEHAGLSHNDLMRTFRRRHPAAVPDLADVGELPGTLPENAEPAPRNVTPVPGNPPEENPSR